MMPQHIPSTLALGAVVEAWSSEVELQPLCVREEGSTEWYPDSREDPIVVSREDIVRVMDTFPSQRPIPSLGGGEWFCWWTNFMCSERSSSRALAVSYIPSSLKLHVQALDMVRRAWTAGSCRSCGSGDHDPFRIVCLCRTM